MRPNPRQQNAAIPFGDLTNYWVLINSDKNLVREDVDENEGDHDQTCHDFGPIQENSARFILLSPKTLTNQSFKCPVESLNNGKAEHIDEHVSHADPRQKCRLILVSHIVGVDQLDEQIQKHANYGGRRHFGHNPKALQDGHF